MPKVEVRTRLRPLGNKRKPAPDAPKNQFNGELIMELLLTPRGSGNRKFAIALAKAAKNHPRLGPHVKSVKAGSSKVWIILIPSLGLMKTIWQWTEQQTTDVPGQLSMFGVPLSG
jgi:hypothetical protein